MNEKNRKFELTGEEFLGRYRIRALSDFGKVKRGDLGGFLTREENLSQEGNCWVYDNARISGNARVIENANVSGIAKVGDNAVICGDAIVGERASVMGDAVIGGKAEVYGKSLVAGDVKMYEGTLLFNFAILSQEDLKEVLRDWDSSPK